MMFGQSMRRYPRYALLLTAACLFLFCQSVASAQSICTNCDDRFSADMTITDDTSSHTVEFEDSGGVFLNASALVLSPTSVKWGAFDTEDNGGSAGLSLSVFDPAFHTVPLIWGEVEGIYDGAGQTLRIRDRSRFNGNPRMELLITDVTTNETIDASLTPADLRFTMDSTVISHRESNSTKFEILLVPEPTTLAMLGGAAVLMMRRRLRRV